MARQNLLMSEGPSLMPQHLAREKALGFTALLPPFPYSEEKVQNLNSDQDGGIRQHG